eukprot:13129094-Heterocapsa_arctica.AAC.1
MAQEDTENITITAAEMQEAIRGIEKKFEVLMDMHNKSTQITEELESIREIMNIMMTKVVNWTGVNYPDRDRINREAQEEHKALGEDMTGKAAERQKDDRADGQVQEMMGEDIRNIRSFRLTESTEVWRTGMTNEELGELTQWMRKRTTTIVER